MAHSKEPRESILVAGVGMTPVGEHWGTSFRELALEAITAARNDAGGLKPQSLYVANALAPALSGQSHLGALLADFAGLRGIEAATIEASGASGGMAFRQAYLALRAGAFDTALIVGAEKVTDKVSADLDAALVTAGDADYEAVHGVTRTAQAALLMQRYLYEYGAPPDALAGFSENAHANGVTNRYAMFRRALRPGDYAKAPMISEPVNMFDAAPLADGAAAILLARESVLPPAPDRVDVRVLGSAGSTAALALHDQRDLLRLAAAADSAERAMQEAGVKTDEVDVFELHDLFSIYAALSLEAAGFAGPGEGFRLSQDGAIARDGRIPIATFGGSKARGDVPGATGLYQLVEVILQLQGRAGENQVPGARIGMAQCLGGTGGTAVTHVLGRNGSESG